MKVETKITWEPKDIKAGYIAESSISGICYMIVSDKSGSSRLYGIVNLGTGTVSEIKFTKEQLAYDFNSLHAIPCDRINIQRKDLNNV